MGDGLSTLYQDLLSASYDCVDRIVLNAYFRMGHNPGGFRLWWRALTGSDETLANTYLMRMGRALQSACARLRQGPRYSGDRLLRRAAQTRYRRRISGQDNAHPRLVSGLGWSRPGSGVGCERQTPHRT